MAWTEITRLHYRREGLRYASDATDAEWSLIEPFMPVANSIGRPRKTNIREVVNALFYIASTGCQWRQLPKSFRRTRPCRAISILGRATGRG